MGCGASTGHNKKKEKDSSESQDTDNSAAPSGENNDAKNKSTKNNTGTTPTGEEEQPREVEEDSSGNTPPDENGTSSPPEEHSPMVCEAHTPLGRDLTPSMGSTGPDATDDLATEEGEDPDAPGRNLKCRKSFNRSSFAAVRSATLKIRSVKFSTEKRTSLTPGKTGTATVCIAKRGNGSLRDLYQPPQLGPAEGHSPPLGTVFDSGSDRTGSSTTPRGAGRGGGGGDGGEELVVVKDFVMLPDGCNEAVPEGTIGLPGVASEEVGEILRDLRVLKKLSHIHLIHVIQVFEGAMVVSPATKSASSLNILGSSRSPSSTHQAPQQPFICSSDSAAIDPLAETVPAMPVMENSFEVGVAAQRFSVISEYADGGNAREMLGQTQEEVIIELIVGVVKALRFLRAHGQGHLNITPENVLYVREGQFCLGDSGWQHFFQTLSPQALHAMKKYNSNSSHFPPEYIDSGSISDRNRETTDCWALGVLCYRLMYDADPFGVKEDMSFEELSRCVVENVPSFSEENDAGYDFSTDLQEVVASLLEKNPVQRLTVLSIMQHPFMKRIRGEKNRTMSMIKSANSMASMKKHSASPIANVLRTDSFAFGFTEFVLPTASKEDLTQESPTAHPLTPDGEHLDTRRISPRYSITLYSSLNQPSNQTPQGSSITGLRRVTSDSSLEAGLNSASVLLNTSHLLPDKTADVAVLGANDSLICSECRSDIRPLAFRCMTCDAYILCGGCYMKEGDRHNPTHNFQSFVVEEMSHDRFEMSFGAVPGFCDDDEFSDSASTSPASDALLSSQTSMGASHANNLTSPQNRSLTSRPQQKRRASTLLVLNSKSLSAQEKTVFAMTGKLPEQRLNISKDWKLQSTMEVGESSPYTQPLVPSPGQSPAEVGVDELSSQGDRSPSPVPLDAVAKAKAVASGGGPKKVRILMAEGDDEAHMNPEEVIKEARVKGHHDLLLVNRDLTSLPALLFAPDPLTFITILDVGKNQLAEIPDTISALTSLQKLYLGENKLTELPDSVGDLAGLEVLDVNHNLLVDLPVTLMFNDSLTSISMDYNRCTEFPGVLFEIPSLRTIYIAANVGIHTWPEVRQLKCLSECKMGVDNEPRLFTSFLEIETEVSACVSVQWNKVYPDEIVPGLYCGSLRSAQTPHVYEAMHIGAILTVGRGLEPTVCPGMKHLCIVVDDIDGATIHNSFDTAISFIDDVLSTSDETGGCLVHCFAGMSRSSTTIIAYLMMKKGMRMDEAYLITKKGRPAIYPNQGFFKQLIALDAKLFPDGRPLDIASLHREIVP